MKNVMENLMKEALIDVTPANNEIYLMVPQTKGGKANKRKKINADKKFAKGRSHIVSVSDEQKVCAKALECLNNLLVYQGVLMKPVLFFIMQEKIVAIGFAISSKIQQDGDLYRDPHCRSKLLDLVGLMMTHPVHKMPVPLNYGIALLTKLKHSDPDLNVRESASVNLLQAETTIHNRKDVLYFPPEYSDLRETLMFNKQTIHKFNEATNSQQEVNGKHEEKPIEMEIEKETVKDDEDILISDDETIDSDVQVVQVIQSPKKNETFDEPEVISDEEKEISDKEEEISDEEIVVVTQDPPKPPPAAEKRSTRSSATTTVAKKRKVSAKNDDDVALLEEYLADFTDEAA